MRYGELRSPEERERHGEVSLGIVRYGTSLGIPASLLHDYEVSLDGEAVARNCCVLLGYIRGWTSLDASALWGLLCERLVILGRDASRMSSEMFAEEAR